jgi:hypothetical protein
VSVAVFISRAGHKAPDPEIEDLKKARWCLDRHIETLEQERAGVSAPPSDYPRCAIVQGKGE